MNKTSVTAIVLFPFFLSAISAFIISKLGCRLSLVNTVNERSSHSAPTSRGGGIGIWIAAVLAGIFVLKELVFTVAVTAIGLLGFLDDLFMLSAKQRLCIQVAVSVIVITAFWGIPTSAVKILLCAFWVIFVTGTSNFYNFMDGINGIAGLTGAAAFSLTAYYASFVTQNPDIALISAVLAAACLGFLPFNIPRARVFMGDVGSLVLGFIFAVMVMRLSQSLLDFVCLVSFLFPFYVDELTTEYVRLRGHEKLTLSHRKHLYQLLVNEMNMPHWKISFAYVLVQLVIAFCVLALRPLGEIAVISMLGVYFWGALWLTFNVRAKLKAAVIQKMNGAE